MRQITGWLYAWGARQLASVDRQGYSGVNLLYRVLRDGGMSGTPPTSRPLISDRHTADDTLIEAAIARLPNRQQQCVVLAHCGARHGKGEKYGKEYTQREYAHLLGISRSAFKEHVQRGKKSLETIIKDLREKRDS